MRQRLPLTIDGADFSKAAQIHGYSIQYEDRLGGNGGLLLSGDEVVDLLDRKAVITWRLNDLPGDTLAQIMTACKPKYVTVLFWDTMLNTTRTSTFSSNIGSQKMTMITPAGIRWFSGPVLTLRER